MTDSTLLDELAKRRGLGEAYYDHRGTLKHFSSDSRYAILRAMGLPIDDESAIRAILSEPMEPVAPAGQETCFQPPALESDRCWGLSIQLYTLRSARNWGIGDFADLRELIDLSAPLGCDVIGLNPLHALFLADPKHSSPYSPSSRMFLNALYIAVDDIPEFSTCASVQALCAQTPFVAALDAVRATSTVMYEQVATLKLCALRLLYAHFVEVHIAQSTERAASLQRFVSDNGDWLYRHALFEALDAQLRSRYGGGAQLWPADYRNFDADVVRDFASEHTDEIRFYMYLQWIADEQLAGVQRHAREKGMRIGLYGDLAVGSSPDGSEVWSNPTLYVSRASVGAPPDPLALNGQDWGIPAIDPYVLRTQSFAPFSILLRANMKRIGALRIDHVMALFRLWWVPRGFSAVEGVYVHYPLERLLDVLVEESRRAACLIIGEDLGTVPDEMRRAMETHRLYHYKVMLFEKHDDGSMKAPGEYARHAVATATTHDLPPLKAWWQSDDIVLRAGLNLYPSPETAAQLQDERARDRCSLLRALTAAGLWHWRDGDALPDFSLPLARAIHLFLGQSNAALVLVQLEDLIGMTDPINVPGTHTEYPNWQRKIERSTHDIFTNASIAESLKALGKARVGLDPNV